MQILSRWFLQNKLVIVYFKNNPVESMIKPGIIIVEYTVLEIKLHKNTSLSVTGFIQIYESHSFSL